VSSDDTTAAAARYREMGWNPVPIKDRSKETILVHLAPYLRQKITAEDLNAWAWPGVGIVTGRVSGLLVLDVDGPKGEAVLKEHGHPPTPMVRTPSGGLHLYFRHPQEDIKTAIRIAPELDVKAAGGYVVAPPSRGPNGKSYQWLISPEDTEPAVVPEWVMRRIKERTNRNGWRSPAPPVGERIAAGERNQALTSLGGTMRRRGMDEDAIFAALQVTNEQRCTPPLTVDEVRGIARSVAGYVPAENDAVLRTGKQTAGVEISTFNTTDLGNAERLVHRHGKDLRYVHAWRRWLVWDGTRWRTDDTGEIRRRAKETVRSIYQDAADSADEGTRKTLASHAMKSEAEPRVNALVALAKSEAGIPATPDQLDADPWLLNVANGTLDLRTGELREHRREDLITKSAPVHYDSNAIAPTWEAFLARVLPSEPLRRFVQRAMGYSLTADARERVLLIMHGTGRNGKSTLLEAVREVMGDYAMKSAAETLMAKPAGGVPNDIARLKGARFVSASETEANRRLAEALVKEITGNDTVSARFMRAEWFDFKPTHKTWLATNHKPTIQGTDPAIWDRVRLIPFKVRIPDQEVDRELPERLRVELPGILAWAVRGCVEWRAEGLGVPDEVKAATEGYRVEMDVLAAFLDERCVISANVRAQASALYGSYRQWCEETGEKPESQRAFGMRLGERGFDRRKSRGVYWWLGIGLPDGGPAPQGGDHRDEGDHEGPFFGMKNISTPHEASSENQVPQGPSSPSGASSAEIRLTEEEVQRVRQRIREGMEPERARAAVLAKRGGTA
jgi:putative DNA primase/helicase